MRFGAVTLRTFGPRAAGTILQPLSTYVRAESWAGRSHPTLTLTW